MEEMQETKNKTAANKELKMYITELHRMDKKMDFFLML
jgi:hypothetical protein